MSSDRRCKDYDPNAYVPPPARCDDEHHYPPCELAGDPGRIGLEDQLGPMPLDLKILLAGVLTAAVFVAVLFVVGS